MKKTFLLVLLSVVMVSCQKATFLNSKTQEIEFGTEGGKCVVDMESDASNFSLEYAPEWAKVELVDASFLCTVPENDGVGMRCDSIVISCGGMSITFPICQYKEATYLTANPNEVKFGVEGGTVEIAIDTDGANVEVEDLPTNMTSKYIKGTLSLTAPENQGKGYKRELTLKCNEQTAKLIVEQNGSICARCGGKGKVVCSNCHGSGSESDGWGCGYCGGHDWGPGTGRVTCPACGGKGYK